MNLHLVGALLRVRAIRLGKDLLGYLISSPAPRGLLLLRVPYCCVLTSFKSVHKKINTIFLKSYLITSLRNTCTGIRKNGFDS